jgi:hypothetical protein
VRVQPEVLVNLFGNYNFYVAVVGKEVLHSGKGDVTTSSLS